MNWKEHDAEMCRLGEMCRQAAHYRLCRMCAGEPGILACWLAGICGGLGRALLRAEAGLCKRNIFAMEKTHPRHVQRI